MATIHLPADLAEAFNADPVLSVEASTLAQLLQALEVSYPGMSGWLTEADGSVRQHLSCFVEGYRVKPGREASTALDSTTEVWVLRAVSGG